MELDPKTGWMWVIDTGRVNIFTEDPVNHCPPKLVILDTRNAGAVICQHTFPKAVLSYESNFVNDIVVDPINGIWAYMSDVGIGPITGNQGGIVVYDYE
jgi:hypothetical protein